MQDQNVYLLIGAVLSFVASILHILIIIGGPGWYRFFGAGEKFASAAAAGEIYPHVVTVCIAALLASWGVYALSGAGIVRELPFLKQILIVITTVYLMRGLAFIPLLMISHTYSIGFLIWNSVICLIYGVFHLVGLAQVWAEL